MYVDESGDSGLSNSPTDFFVLSGMVLHELRWNQYLNQLVDFRRRMRTKYGLKLREEIHSAEMIRKPGKLGRIKRHDRLAIIRAFAKELASMTDLNVINIVVQKRAKSQDPFEIAWQALIQRFENTISYRQFRGPMNSDDRGTIFPDHTDDWKLIRLVRKMRKWNPIPNRMIYGPGYRNLQIKTIVEDPAFRDSGHSFFIQACDLIAFLLMQKLNPNKYMKRNSGHNYFNGLDPILCKVASSADPQGIVRL